jgi:hypothetical protein
MNLRSTIAAIGVGNFGGPGRPSREIQECSHAVPVAERTNCEATKYRTNNAAKAESIIRSQACRDRMRVLKSEPAKRVSPITLQALIPTTRRLAWLRLIGVYRKSPPFALQ